MKKLIFPRYVRLGCFGKAAFAYRASESNESLFTSTNTFRMALADIKLTLTSLSITSEPLSASTAVRPFGIGTSCIFTAGTGINRALVDICCKSNVRR